MVAHQWINELPSFAAWLGPQLLSRVEFVNNLVDNHSSWLVGCDRLDESLIVQAAVNAQVKNEVKSLSPFSCPSPFFLSYPYISEQNFIFALGQDQVGAGSAFDLLT